MSYLCPSRVLHITQHDILEGVVGFGGDRRRIPPPHRLSKSATDIYFWSFVRIWLPVLHLALEANLKYGLAKNNGKGQAFEVDASSTEEA